MSTSLRALLATSFLLGKLHLLSAVEKHRELPCRRGRAILSCVAFNTSVVRALKRDTLRRITSKDKQYELILKYLRAYHEVLEDKSRLTKKHYFNSVFELFDEVVKKTKKEHGSVTLTSLQHVITPICNPPEENIPRVQKRDTLIEIMRSRLNSDTSISDEDI